MNKKVGITLRGVTLDNIAPNIDENMMEELLNNRKLYSDFVRGFNPNIETVANLTRERDALKYLLQEYKDLEEQGLLLRLPCKVGDMVYIIPSEVNFKLNVLSGLSKNNRIYHQKVSRIVLDSDSWYVECDKDREYGTGNVLVDIFYKKTWFLTREEAEAKLKEMEE